jgi:hypothetical protein
MGQQSLGYDRQERSVLLVDKEMISLQHTYATAARSLRAPAFEFRLISGFIFRSSERCE